MRGALAAAVALAAAALGVGLLGRSSPAPRPPSRLDPLTALTGGPSPRPLSRAQITALERYGHPSGPLAGALPALSPSVPAPAREHRLVLAGEPLHSSPQPAAAVLGHVAATATVPVLARAGTWALVRARALEGWVPADRLVRLGEPAEAAPPLGAEPEPTLPVPAVPADPARLARARALLDLGRTRLGRLGPWTLVTDVEDEAALESLDAVAGRLEDAYRRRLELVPVGLPRETVVVFAESAAYGAFRRNEGPLAGERVAGHAGAGLAALALGDRGAEAAVESLVHELTHLLNRRAIGPALPPWLDEGLANDLALCRRTPAGVLELGTLSSRRQPRGTREVTIEGGEALALVARRRLGSLVPLSELLALEPAAFLRPGESELHYAESFLFVRFLLDGRHGEAFRDFLRAVSQGAALDPESLRTHLGGSWSRLQAEFETWLGFTIVP